MTLIIILLVLGLQRFLDLGAEIPRLHWFHPYLVWVQDTFKKTPFWGRLPSILLILLPPLIIIAIVQGLLDSGSWLFGAIKFLFGFIILFYCLQSYQLRNQLAGYFSALQKEDKPLIAEQAANFIASNSKIVSDTKADLVRAVTYEIFLQTETGLFGILFWFILLGPVGAVAYYLIVKLRDLANAVDSEFVELAPAANWVFGLLDWLPVRVLGLSYSLMGYFVAGITYWRKHFFKPTTETENFAINSGLAALNIEHVDVVHADIEENEAALALIDRAVYLWVVAVAIFTLGGWL